LVSRYNASMSPASSPRKGKKSPPPGDTGQESLYLRFLSEKQVPITVKLRDGESVQGWIEYFDDKMVRLTRDGKPNLFIYKHQIKTITENAKRRRAPRKAGAAIVEPTATPVNGVVK
jgi:host factor-I protein